MARSITVPGPLISFRSEKQLSPGMHRLLLLLADAIDQKRDKSAVSDAEWVTLPAAELRGGRDDNHWLRHWLRRLTGLTLEGEYRGVPWGAVMVAEWEITGGGSLVRMLVPPRSVNMLRAPETFAKVERECLLRLEGPARELYLGLADRRRQERRDDTEFPLAELRELLGAGGKKAYDRWDHFEVRVLRPALDRINDLGTVDVTATPVRVGRPIGAVRFQWRWKTLDEAREVAEENDRHRSARRKPRDMPRDAAPLGPAADPRARDERGPVPEVREYLESRS